MESNVKESGPGFHSALCNPLATTVGYNLLTTAIAENRLLLNFYLKNAGSPKPPETAERRSSDSAPQRQSRRAQMALVQYSGSQS